MKINEFYGDYKIVELTKNKRGKRRYKAKCKLCKEILVFSKKSLLELPICTHNDVSYPKLTRKDVNLESVDNMYETFKKKVSILQDKLDTDTMDAKTQFQIATLKMTIDLIPISERAYREDPKVTNMSMLVQNINMVRELLADVVVDDNKSDLVNSIIDRNIIPLGKDAIQITLDHYYLMIRMVQGLLNPKQFEEFKKTCDVEILKAVGMTISAKTGYYATKIREELE